MTDWQEQLITIYLYICKPYREKLWVYCQRMSNYANLSFTDEEVITIYRFGIIDGQTQHRKIDKYTHRHWRDWFPTLPSYTAFIPRLNQVAEVFAPLLEIIVTKPKVGQLKTVWLRDSFPVALAKPGHRFQAQVAPPIANAGYCSTNKWYYYGVRVHLVGRSQPGTRPYPEYIGITGASHNDGKVFEQIRPVLHHNELYGDKAYQLADADDIKQKPGLLVRTPLK